ncbi:MAG: SUMF1/EgtB/PvdO family nonheme iron enzyme [Polyangiaceae bacterium]|nr:SUMF1/EgtB/PvdO family nonheme iron enzyme [Polyangiaceae bacterium]
MQFDRWRSGSTLVIGVASLVACGREEASSRPAPPDLTQSQTQIPQSSVTLGFADGTLRTQVALPSFRISTHPITQQQYQACVAAHACGAPLNTCAAELSAGSAPELAIQTCVGVQNAQKYCAWAGGQLPNLSEWFLAARGPNVAPFSWGTEAATCERHPFGKKHFSEAEFTALKMRAGSPWKLEELLAQESDCGSAARSLTVKGHPEGASPLGVQDVLLAPAELAMGQPESPVSACSGASPCLIYRDRHAVISNLGPIEDRAREPAADPSGGQAAPEYAFRCVWKDGGTAP